jgi:NAD+ kinase
MKIAVFGKQFGSIFYEKCNDLFEYLATTNCEIFIYKPFYEFLTKTAGIKPVIKGYYSNHKDLPECNMLFSIGGDGTFLDAVTIVRHRNIPIVGINSGRLGFLADIAMEELPMAINEIIDGKYTTRELDLLGLEATTPCFGELNFALNELAIHKRDSSSMITIHTNLNNAYLNSYWADGLIISTPTGSTAYSLSVGGPIVHPSCREFIIAPIAPHNLTVRPLIVPIEFEISLRVECRGGKFLASLDSRSCILDDSIELRIRKAEFTITVLERIGQSFYSTLRSKLMWGADRRN